VVEENWTWSLSLIALTIVFHAAAMAAMALALVDIYARVTRWRLPLRHVFAILVGLIGAVGLVLAILHGIEASVWAAAYWRLGALGSFQDAVLYSLDSMTTRGASGLALQPHWALMGALEAADGMLLFGISTAFVFAVMQAYWPILTEAHRTR
jgi:hypothetical protein